MHSNVVVVRYEGLSYALSQSTPTNRLWKQCATEHTIMAADTTLIKPTFGTGEL